MTTEKSVIVGRFQLPFLNGDHLSYLSRIIYNSSEVLFVIGLSYCQASREDPLDYQTRVNMIKNYFSSDNISFAYIKDEYEDGEWSRKLDSLVSKIFGKTNSRDVTIYGSRENFINRYSGLFQTKEMFKISIESEELLKKQISSYSMRGDDFRYGAFHVALNQFANPMPCVDIALVDEDSGRILLGKKNGQNEYRFFGGFCENFGSYEDDAVRELIEETSLRRENFGDPKYICSQIVDDWRYRYTERKIKTSLFLIKYFNGDPKASDDIETIKWFTHEEFRDLIKDSRIVKGHLEMAKKLADLYKNK
jgi:ADP-ribose pyrophosphatase YjhB (NUDIX family)/nicotinamide mononucleotide adenylyltransferase